MIRQLGLALLSLALVLSATAQAQTFYIDLGPDAPSSAYGGPYGEPGVWNAVPLVGGLYPLVDATGAGGSVTAHVGTYCFPAGCDVPELSGDDAALLEDWWSGTCYIPATIDLVGLAPGQYQLFAVGYSACTPSAEVLVTVWIGSNHTSLWCGGVPFTGSWAEFPIGRTTLSVGQSVMLYADCFAGDGGLAGFQLVRLGDDPTTFCSGHLGDCPCEPGAAGHGCPSSFDADGARLEGSGQPDLDADTVVLTATGVSSSVVTFLQGDTLLGAGSGIPFGDGLRCVGGSVVRLASKLASGGVATFPEAGDPPLSIRGAIPPWGGFRAYQVWYRNPTSHCTSATHNFTNALAMRWH